MRSSVTELFHDHSFIRMGTIYTDGLSTTNRIIGLRFGGWRGGNRQLNCADFMFLASQKTRNWNRNFRVFVNRRCRRNHHNYQRRSRFTIPSYVDYRGNFCRIFRRNNLRNNGTFGYFADYSHQHSTGNKHTIHHRPPILRIFAFDF